MLLNRNLHMADRRIARNTLLLFVRMGLLMLINILSVRYLRAGMGVVEYGILTAVTGLVNMVSCFNTVLSTASQRYLSVALGQNDTALLGRTFRSSVRICLLLIAGVVVLMETVGLWFVAAKMSYPPERETAVLIAYQMTVLTFVFTLLHIPYLAAIIAHEKMNVFAGITLLDALLKLLLAFAIRFMAGDRLIGYTVCLAGCSLLTLAVYAVYSHTHFGECRLRGGADRQQVREMLGFSGWSFFGALAGVCMLQGTLLLLNVEAGPVANAAFAVSLTIFTAFSQLGNNITLAVRPQLIMACSAHDAPRTSRLYHLSTLAIVALMAMVAVPFQLWMPQIVGLWLGDADPLTVAMCRGMMWVAVVLCVATPITTIMQALGRVREYHLPVESITLLCIPVGCLMLRLGCPPERICLGLLACCLAAHLVRLERLWRYCPESLLTRIRK